MKFGSLKPFFGLFLFLILGKRKKNERKLKQSGGNANESIKTSLQLAFGADHQRGEETKKGGKKNVKE
jgi:hypothetical protein